MLRDFIFKYFFFNVNEANYNVKTYQESHNA